MPNPKPKVICVVGTTASGKTSLAIELAKEFSGEVISADSRQVYRGLNIATGKVTEEETQKIPHHLIDVADIEDTYTVSDFTHDARIAITRITNREHLPIIAGGTFFYVDALLGKSPVAEVPPNPELRAELEQKKPRDLFRALEKLDRRRAAEIDPDNKRRLIRALEIVAELGAVPKPTPRACPYDVLTIGIERSKEELTKRFATRLDAWLTRGLLDEVRDLHARGISPERLAEIGFEYELVSQYINGTIDEKTFRARFVSQNWQYAKRQLTWLKRHQDIHWFKPDAREGIFSTVSTWLAD